MRPALSSNSVARNTYHLLSVGREYSFRMRETQSLIIYLAIVPPSSYPYRLWLFDYCVSNAAPLSFKERFLEVFVFAYGHDGLERTSPEGVRPEAQRMNCDFPEITPEESFVC
jgi:hypothetical protein